MNANERELILKEEVVAIVGAAIALSYEPGVCSEVAAIGVHSRSFAVDEREM